ncbi:nitrogenase component 1 [Dorea sp. YH-dor226]|uniref:nitrogenase component 1 n=1 Tax=Dorea sp. YH-dor226 TaxID=3151119 RepID=UPI003241D3E2
MARLFQKTGSFAGDYSGAAGVLQEMDGMLIFCDAGACMGGFLFGEDPKGGNEERRIFSASLREKQIVMGIDKKLKKDAIRTYHETGGSFVGLIGTPVAAVTGLDLEGLGKEICRGIYKQGFTDNILPSMGVDTNGWETYDAGQEKAYLALAKMLIRKEEDNISDVNIIGATSIDMWDYNQMEDCVKLLKKAGAKNPVVWGARGSMGAIAGAAGAKMNLAVSVSAVKVVKQLHENYGTPYMIGYPFGEKDTVRWTEQVRNILSGKELGNVAFYSEESGKNKSGKSAFIIGEQMTSCAMRSLLRKEFDYDQVDVASFFKMDRMLMKGNDFWMKDEEVLVNFLEEQEQYDLVIADPFCFQFLPYVPKKKIAYPHIAVSSLLYMGQSVNIFGEKASMYFKKVLEE